MSTFRRALVIVALGFGFAVTLIGPRYAAAQDQTIGPLVPDAALCQAEPRTVEELAALFAASPAAGEPVVPDQVSIPAGRIASPELADEIRQAVVEAIACLNSGNFLSFLSILTDDAVLTAFGWLGQELALGVNPWWAATPVAPADEAYLQTLVSVAEVRVLADGRVGAFIVVIDPGSGNLEPEVIHLVFVREGERWLIDEVAEFTRE
jgi:hypothetical protein